VTDIVRHFGVVSHAVLGYSLGESAGLFALDAWRDRDGMLARMEASTLFTLDLAGECRAARSHWGMGPEEEVRWRIGVVDAPAAEVRRAVGAMTRVYLLIVNTPEECVIGGDDGAVTGLVALLGCRFFPLRGVTTAHCAAAAPVAAAYRELHRFEVFAPPGVTFYSPAWGRPYSVDRESAADSMLTQALEGIDYPRVIESAYADGVRIFIEMGPGGSCSRMISRILAGRPHMARSACFPEMEPESAVLRLLGHLVAERVRVDLSPLYPRERVEMGAGIAAPREPLRVRCGGTAFQPPLPSTTAPATTSPPAPPIPPFQGGNGIVTSPDKGKTGGVADDSLLRQFAAAQAAGLAAHDAYLRFSEQMTRSMGEALALQLSLQEMLADGSMSDEMVFGPLQEGEGDKTGPRPLFDREMCLEFARGKVGLMLGPAFAEADAFPTRVRLPDEPLMPVDRIVALDGEARSMTSGRVATEHDIHENAWYLDAGRIPTCIAVEAGQADLFLSGYLGIDFVTRGLAVYRLLDAVVTFHRELPGPGETIHYDIRIERFFQQGETRLFRFRFDATVDGAPLLTMRDGCAGFFTATELAAGRGIVAKKLDLAPRSGTRPDDWMELVPLLPETYDAAQLDQLRQGDLAGCFGPLFAGLGLASPLTIPGGRMRLVHRVTALEPAGGRYGLGLIHAEADIRPDDWFLTCHFTDDRVMPGTLMYECCLHTLRIFLLRMGWVAETAVAAWEPVPGVASRLCCRGQVLETTRTVTYEVTIRELGYRPEPYAVVDALMYADGKAIVEITGMSARLSGTTKEALVALWQRRNPQDIPVQETRGDGRKPAIYTKEQILAYSNGRPSEGFGERYRVFDGERIIARLPGPPFQFMDRVTDVQGEPWRMQAGARVEAQYDVPQDAWYFGAERQPIMPFSVLLEAALQPCGWLAAYVGSALTSPTDLSFRNLGGNAVRHRPVTPESGTLTAVASLTKVATSGGMIIQEYTFAVSDRAGVLYEGDTMFGFFSREALANQVGIRDAAPYKPSPEETGRGKSLPYPDLPPFPEKRLRMIDLIELFVADGGPAGLGYVRGLKVVDPDEWFFKAHFFQDPVTPGSLGLESFLQLLKYVAVERWGLREGSRFSAAVPERRHDWLYRGQVTPANRQVVVEAWITAADDGERILTADGLLSVDGRPIYRMKDFTLGME
ncbi:MAG TPA: type I polyketide synthase, partial [Desulfuromonadaceae bacterium]